MENPNNQKTESFSSYQVFIIVILTFINFTVILDFMVLAPLGTILMPALNINPKQFSLVVSAYALSAGASGILAAGFADKFDRKKLLTFFYVGFLIGTSLCAIANDYYFLLIARIVTGIFGGVLSSIAMAIITDIFKMEQRGKVMGFVQMAFASSQILGLPLGLYIANKLDWHFTFWLIVLFGVVAGLFIIFKMQPIDEHLKYKNERNALSHLIKTFSNTSYQKVFLSTVLLATGGYMLMPFGSDFSTNNLGISKDDLPLMYWISGGFTIFAGIFAGRLSDKFGQFVVFLIGTIISLAIVLFYCNLSITPLWVVILLNAILFIGITCRIVASSSLTTAIPDPQDRGAFMSINSSIQQISGGIAAFCAGLIVIKRPDGMLENYNILGYVVSASMLITIVFVFIVDKMAKEKKISGKKI